MIGVKSNLDLQLLDTQVNLETCIVSLHLNDGKQLILIGASLSEPHTSESSGTSITFTKIYVEIRIARHVNKSLRLKSDYKPDNLQMLPVCTLITRRITRVVYWCSI